MPRNLDHRVELAAPIESPELRAELLDTLERASPTTRAPGSSTREGIWQRRSPGPGEEPRNLQLELAELLRRARRGGAPAGEHDLAAAPLGVSAH